MRESDWKVLIDKIERRQCTPFLGAGVSAPHVPLPDGTMSSTQDDGGPGQDELSTVQMRQNGPHQIVIASSDPNKVGAFRISVTQHMATAPP